MKNRSVLCTPMITWLPFLIPVLCNKTLLKPVIFCLLVLGIQPVGYTQTSCTLTGGISVVITTNGTTTTYAIPSAAGNKSCPTTAFTGNGGWANGIGKNLVYTFSAPVTSVRLTMTAFNESSSNPSNLWDAGTISVDGGGTATVSNICGALPLSTNGITGKLANTVDNKYIDVSFTVTSTLSFTVATFTVTAGSGGGAVQGNPCDVQILTILPIRLLHFGAEKLSENVARISWQTAQEQNSSFFEVQHSTDDTNWKPLGQVAAAGNSGNTLSYQYLHNNPVTGVNYYRLKSADIDGAFTCSDIKLLKFDGKNKIAVLPNPVTDRVFITGSAGHNTIKQVQLFDAAAKLVWQSQSLSASTPIDMSGYAKGIYLLKIVTAGGLAETFKLLKK